MLTARHHATSGRGMPILVFASLAAVLLLASPQARGQRVRATGGSGSKKIPLTVSADLKLWLPQFDGTIQAGTDADPGTQIRFDTHLDLEAHPEVYEVGLGLGDVRYGKLTAAFLRFNAPGNKVLVRDIDFGNESFLEPETVHSEFKAELDRVTVRYIQDIRGTYILTYEVGMAFFRWKSSIENRHVGKKASEDDNATLPLTGLHAIFPLGDAFDLNAGFSGVFFQTSGDDVRLVEVYGEFHLRLAEYLLLGLGYRYLNFDGELDLEGGKTGEMEFSLSGVYFTVGFKF